MPFLADVFLTDRAAADHMIFSIVRIEVAAVLAPYLVATVVMDLCKNGWRVLPLIGFWLYIVAFSAADVDENFITECLTGPGVGDKMLALHVAGVAWQLFPILLTTKFICLRKGDKWGQWRSQSAACVKCGYDLQGTVLARRKSCPECGEPVDPSFFKDLPSPVASISEDQAFAWLTRSPNS